MALKTEGPLSLTEIRDEFKPLVGDVSFSELLGIAEGVPASGPLSLSIMLGKAYVFVKLITTTMTNVNVQSLFTPEEWAAETPKQVVIGPTAVVGSSNVSQPAMTIPSGGLGTLKIINEGSIIGAGGITPSQAGGHAVLIQRDSVTIENKGLIAGGGGAGGTGGRGGQGGPGTFVVTVREPSVGEYYVIPSKSDSARYEVYKGNGARFFFWGHSRNNPTIYNYNNASVMNYGGATYYTGSLRYSGERFQRTGPDGDGYNYTEYSWGIYRTYPQTNSSTGGLGGLGTNGGQGAGFNQSLTTPGNGAAGVAGGTNAGMGGTGGRGGAGGDLGQSGANGANGGAGSAGNAGAALTPETGGIGGAAGRAITGNARTLINTGTILGTVNV